MPADEPVRIDKWLWAVRVYKTRTQAAEECRKGRVIINGVSVKPSHVVKVEEIILIRKPPVIYTYKVTGILDKRVSALVAKNFVEDLTSNDELAKREIARLNVNFQRKPGLGRPTKKERREIDKIKEL
jgi:ribosome-associated heat shock protein Hsp15